MQWDGVDGLQICNAPTSWCYSNVMDTPYSSAASGQVWPATAVTSSSSVGMAARLVPGGKCRLRQEGLRSCCAVRARCRGVQHVRLFGSGLSSPAEDRRHVCSPGIACTYSVCQHSTP